MAVRLPSLSVPSPTAFQTILQAQDTYKNTMSYLLCVYIIDSVDRVHKRNTSGHCTIIGMYVRKILSYAFRCGLAFASSCSNERSWSWRVRILAFFWSFKACKSSLPFSHSVIRRLISTLVPVTISIASFVRRRSLCNCRSSVYIAFLATSIS